jgi:hypothetical protein
MTRALSFLQVISMDTHRICTWSCCQQVEQQHAKDSGRNCLETVAWDLFNLRLAA